MPTTGAVGYNSANSSFGTRRGCKTSDSKRVPCNIVAKLLKLTATLFMCIWNLDRLPKTNVSAFLPTSQSSHSNYLGTLHRGSRDEGNLYRQHVTIGMSSTSNSSDDKKKKTTMKKKGGLTVNPNLVGSISSDGNLEVRQERPKSSTLGVPSKRRKPVAAATTSSSTTISKKERQRTGNGTIDSQKQTLIANKENEPIQVLEAKRCSKVVTIVRYVCIRLLQSLSLSLSLSLSRQIYL